MTTSFQKALAVLASVASVLAGIVTIAPYKFPVPLKNSDKLSREG